jgi:hypothetical protein
MAWLSHWLQVPLISIGFLSMVLCQAVHAYGAGGGAHAKAGKGSAVHASADPMAAFAAGVRLARPEGVKVSVMNVFYDILSKDSRNAARLVSVVLENARHIETRTLLLRELAQFGSAQQMLGLQLSRQLDSGQKAEKLSALRVAGVMALYPGDALGFNALLTAIKTEQDTLTLQVVLDELRAIGFRPRYREELANALRGRLSGELPAELRPLLLSVLFSIDGSTENALVVAGAIDAAKEPGEFLRLLEGVFARGRSYAMPSFLEDAIAGVFARPHFPQDVRTRAARFIVDFTSSEERYDQAAQFLRQADRNALFD